MEIQNTNVRSQNGRLHRGRPSPMQLNLLNKESPHERMLSAHGRNRKLSQKSKFPLKNPGIHTGEAELILAALTGGGLTRKQVSGCLLPFMHTDRDVAKPGLKHKVRVNGINHKQALEIKASGGEKTQSPGVETSLDSNDMLEVVAKAASGRKKGGWQYKKKAGNRLIDLTNVEVWLQRFADTTTSKEETLGLSAAEETDDFRKLDELEKRDDRIPLYPEAAILEESIRKRLAVKSITEQLMQKQRALLAAAKTFMDTKMLDNDTLREFLNNVDYSEAEAHLLAIEQPDGEPSVIFKSESTIYDKRFKKRREYFEDTSDGGADPVPGGHEGSVLSTGYKPSTARSEWSSGNKSLSARSGWSLRYKPLSARSGYFSEGIMFHKSDKFGELTQMHKEMLILKQQLKLSIARSCTFKQRIVLPPTSTKTVNEVQAKDKSNRQGLVMVPTLEKTNGQQGREKQKFQLPRLQLSSVQQQRESTYLGTISSSRYGISPGSSQKESPRRQHTNKGDTSPHKNRFQ